MGKHRKVSNTRRNFTRAALAGAVVAAPFAMTAPANAASESTWDAVAQCESGGNWSTSTGNGYYGGLQFNQSTWSAYGGTEYGSNAAQASKSQQIAVAERVLQAQGPNAWPSCSKKAGLTKSGSAEHQDVASGSSSEKKSTPKKKNPVKKTVEVSNTYTVQAGDTLSSIAEKSGVSWERIFEKNRSDVHDANKIFPGQQLLLK
ncbi:LysM peptidoglycan-binding domain-containing protein [Saccharopolyspora rhizosphaerae]|uniref:LysM peptidoglycan-binding domain-containing protein n=1 Tax=Saccharopolyspora rhizosphaerae TaxID=2492662 RepID=A0A3R8Q835_9PSEU|nr:transglycosylase family protein [Saccharopolyspora rhizosphaerae]RRO20578.1 LysM peptidoglycan-binding domain-containing protein [Saccharopolyspora rhizosphaerae]